MKNKFPILIFFIYFLTGCDSCDNNQSTERSVDDIVKLLIDYRIDEFYSSINQNNQDAVRKKLEEESQNNKKVFNYAVLLNAGLINETNKTIFKPDIKKIDYFQPIENKMLCYMNSAFYNIANSAFFDDFLEIDFIFSTEWKNRDPQNLKIASPILKTLREVIYEIRLGENSTSEKINYLRNRHNETLKVLDDLDIVSGFYKEMLELYKEPSFERNIDKHETGPVFPSSPSAIIPNFNYNLVKEKVNNFIINKIVGGYISTMHHPVKANQDIIYLRALFSMIDPAGSIVRYLSLAIYEDGKEIYLNDGFGREDKLTFDLEKNPAIKLKIFFTNIVDKHMFIDASFIKPYTDNTTGRVILYYDAPQEDEGFKSSIANYNLVAKSRVSSNHQISETYNFHKNQWQTHTFFNKPSFSNKPSSPNSNGYKDFTLYFQIKD